MTAQEIIDKTSSILALAKLIIGIAVGVFASVAVVAIWTNATSTSIAQTRAELNALKGERTLSIADNAKWRSDTEKLLARVTTILENYENTQKHQQAQIDLLIQRVK